MLENPLDVRMCKGNANSPVIFHSHNTVPIEDSSNIFQHRHLKDNSIGSINNVKLENE